jgi:copper chaperone CopZ
MTKRFTCATICILLAVASVRAADDKPAEGKPAELQPVKFRITGLFSPDREADLKEVLKQIPEVTLVQVDFKTSEASFTFDSAKAFPGAKPEQIVEQFDNRLRSASRHTLGIRAVCSIPREKLMFVEIPVVGLDCKGCCLAAYESIYKLEGVEQATASFKVGLITAWIDPEKTNREKLEAALVQRGVTLKPR